MQHRLTISLLPNQHRKLMDFAKRCNISAAWLGRAGIDFLLEIIDTGVVPTGYEGIVVYTLQERIKTERKRTPKRGRKS